MQFRVPQTSFSLPVRRASGRVSRPNGGARLNDPAPGQKVEVEAGWGSDAIAELLRALDIPYIALTPGASFRGLHDSLVNFLGNTRPELLLCVHEETAVALAHGYARVT